MKREFVYVPTFEKSWKQLNLSEKELRVLENLILEKPNIGEIIQGTGGLRKMRFAIGNSGKSHSIRILYIDFSYYEKTYFLFAYPKNELENITDKQKQIFKTMINILLEELRS